MPVTIKDIAQEMGLSQPTVSRILNGDTQHRIAAQTRERVLAAARRMEYRPNAVARSLRRGRTHVVGLYTSHRCDARNDFLSEVLGGLQLACARHHLDLLLHSGFEGRSLDELYDKLCDGRIDGLFLYTVPGDPLIERLAGAPIPVIALADPLPQVPSVTGDNAAGMRLLVDYLWQQGYRQFAYIAPQWALPSVERRLETWQQLLRERGVAPADARVLRVDVEHAAPALETLLPRSGAPCAVSCWNDRTAYSLLQACQARGVRVPDEIAVTGFDGFLDDKLPARQLVTIQCPWVDVAVTATDLLVQQIDGKPIPTETCLPVTFHRGDTA